MIKPKRYVTLDTGVDYRKIAEMMASAGYQMNHATARNQLMLAMEKLLIDVAKQAGAKLTREHVAALLQDQGVHNALADILHVIHDDKSANKKKEGKK